MHDPTEGGLATALQELAFASKVDIVIDESAVNVLPICRAICDALDIDPWGLISSGAAFGYSSARSSRRGGGCVTSCGHRCRRHWPSWS